MRNLVFVTLVFLLPLQIFCQSHLEYQEGSADEFTWKMEDCSVHDQPFLAVLQEEAVSPDSSDTDSQDDQNTADPDFLKAETNRRFKFNRLNLRSFKQVGEYAEFDTQKGIENKTCHREYQKAKNHFVIRMYGGFILNSQFTINIKKSQYSETIRPKRSISTGSSHSTTLASYSSDGHFFGAVDFLLSHTTAEEKVFFGGIGTEYLGEQVLNDSNARFSVVSLYATAGGMLFNKPKYGIVPLLEFQGGAAFLDANDELEQGGKIKDVGWYIGGSCGILLIDRILLNYHFTGIFGNLNDYRQQYDTEIHYLVHSLRIGYQFELF